MSRRPKQSLPLLRAFPKQALGLYLNNHPLTSKMFYFTVFLNNFKSTTGTKMTDPILESLKTVLNTNYCNIFAAIQQKLTNYSCA